MTTEDHIRRVKRAVPVAKPDAKRVDIRETYRDTMHRFPKTMARIRADLERIERKTAEPLICTCQTCGVVNARLRGELSKRGWNHAATHHVRIEGNDFRGGSDVYLAVIKVEGEEIHRAYDDLTELLDEPVLARVEEALRRRLC